MNDSSDESAGEMPPELPPDVQEAIVDGRKIEAIRLLRENWGLGLAEAKAVVDEVSGRDPSRQKPVHRAESADSGIGRLIVFILIFGAIAAVIRLLGGGS